MTSNDLIGVALGSIAAGSSAGAALITAGLIAHRSLQGDGALPQSEQFLLVTGGLVAGITTAILLTFFLSHRVRDLWRRSAIAFSAVFGATLLSIMAAPIDVMVGPAGLIGYAALLTAAAVYAARVARS